MNTLRITKTKYDRTAKQFNTILWCIKAVAEKSINIGLKHLYIDEDFMAGCDGYRIHIAFNEWKYEPGLYEIVMVRDKEILLTKSETLTLENYPSIWNAIPSRCKNGIPPFQCNMDKKAELLNKSRLAYHIFVNAKICCNLKYLEDIRMEGNMRFEVSENRNMLIVASEDHDRLGVIMPILQ